MWPVYEGCVTDGQSDKNGIYFYLVISLVSVYIEKVPLCEALDIGLQPSSSPQTLESTSHTMGMALANISNLYNSFHWALLNWKNACIHSSGVGEKQNISLLLKDRANQHMERHRNAWLGVHLVQNPHPFTAASKTHSATVTDTLSHIAYKISSWTQNKQVYLSVPLLQRKQECLVQMSALSLELWDYHMRRTLITDARSSGVTSEEYKH